MADIIQLLPDSVANQIAAGEVVQRPSSVVKELLENAVDAGATAIDLVIADAGKTLIQVIDNGRGMSMPDARMAFERHATSKITRAEDLFAIRSFGFRGEALASIASVARVDLRTREADAETGVQVVIEGSRFISQELCACQQGTNIQVKDLFFNIPARRQFLKSDQLEMRHIWDEFHHVALPNPTVAFRLFDGTKLLMSLGSSQTMQRIVGTFGKQYQQRLVSVAQDTEYVRLNGFAIKPEFCKKTRGEQFLFVNNRFIRSAYLNSAIKNAYHGLISDDVFPGYFLFLNIDPADIDINIHPTKTEIKFRDERMISALISSAVRRALGTSNLMPSIDFENEPLVDFSMQPDREVRIPQIKINPDYNPFKNSVQPVDFTATERSRERWETPSFEQDVAQNTLLILDQQENVDQERPANEVFLQIGRKYIISSVKSGLLLVDQNAAHQRILFDEFMGTEKTSSTHARLLMFPENLTFGASDAAVMAEITDELNNHGFVISQLGRDMFSVSAVPESLDLRGITLSQLLEAILEDYKASGQIQAQIYHSVVLSMAKKLAVKHGQFLSSEMMQLMISKLFATSNPEVSPEGRKTYKIINASQLNDLLQ